MTLNIESKLHNLTQTSTSSLSMDKQSKLQENDDKIKRYSGLFEPWSYVAENLKNGQTRRSTGDALEWNMVNRNNYPKIEYRPLNGSWDQDKQLLEPNLLQNKSTKRSSGYFVKEITVGDQISTKLIDLDLLKKKFKNERSKQKNILKKTKPDENVSKNQEMTDVNSPKKMKLRSAVPKEKRVTFKENNSKIDLLDPKCKSSIEKEIQSIIENTNSENSCKKNSVRKKTVIEELENTARSNYFRFPTLDKVIKRRSGKKSEGVTRSEQQKSKERNKKSTAKKEVDQTIIETSEEPELIDPKILDYYIEKNPILQKFNNLETIFEQPRGPDVMGRRKLKRYLNFNDTNNSLKRAQRQDKVRKIKPRFQLESIDLNVLKNKNVDDLLKI